MLTVTHEPHLMKRGLNFDSWITKEVASFVKRVAELSNEDTGGILSQESAKRKAVIPTVSQWILEKKLMS